MRKLTELFHGKINSESLIEDFERNIRILPGLEEAKSSIQNSISECKKKIMPVIYSALRDRLDDKNYLFPFVNSALKTSLYETTAIIDGEYIDEIILGIHISNIQDETRRKKMISYINESWVGFGIVTNHNQSGSSYINFVFHFN